MRKKKQPIMFSKYYSYYTYCVMQNPCCSESLELLVTSYTIQLGTYIEIMLNITYNNKRMSVLNYNDNNVQSLGIETTNTLLGS